MTFAPPVVPESPAGLSSAWTTVAGEAAQAAADAAETDAIVGAITGAGDLGAAAAIGGALAFIDLPDVILVVFALLMAFALIELLFKPIGDAFGNIPIVGGAIRSLWYSVPDTINAGLSYVGSPIMHAGKIMLTFLYSISFGALHSLQHAVLALANSSFAQFYQILPVKFYDQSLYTAWALDTADNNADQLYNQSISHTDQSVAQEHAQMLQAISSERQYADFVLTQADNNADQLYNQAIAHADFNLTQADNNADQLYNQTQGQLQQGFAQTKTYTDTSVNTAVQELTSAIAGAAASAAVATATVQSNLQKYLDDCGEPICQANKQNSNNLNGLAQALEAGALFAFLYACIKDPKDMADATEATAGVLVGLAGTALDAVVGAVI